MSSSTGDHPHRHRLPFWSWSGESGGGDWSACHWILSFGERKRRLYRRELNGRRAGAPYIYYIFMSLYKKLCIEEHIIQAEHFILRFAISTMQTNAAR
jgi:hypothetical protein